MSSQLVELALSSRSAGTEEQAQQDVPSEEANDERATCHTPDVVLSVLSDSHARMILTETADQPCSVDELVSRSDMSTATAYRKVNQLVEAELLAEEMCIRPNGANFREFTLRVDTVHISLTGEPAVTLSPRTTPNATARSVSTDGGIPDTESDSCKKQNRLQQIFTAVTGTDEITETRDTAIESRCIDDEDESAISEYVTDVARDDGLSETLTEPDN